MRAIRKGHAVAALIGSFWCLMPSAQEPSDKTVAAEESTPTAVVNLPAPPEQVVTTTARAAEKSGSQDLGEIMVTATRRETSINRVPIAMSELSGENLDSSVVRDTQSLVLAAPSLNIAFSGSETNATIRIRGIGTGGSNGGFEGSVGIFMDGVYLQRPGLALADLVDIARVEVLRGPQGTLFGKNTTVGAIQLYTRKPSFTPEAELRATVGNFGARIYGGSITGPVIDDVLALRLSAQVNEREGAVINLHNGEFYNDRSRHVIRGQALYTPNEKMSLRLIMAQNRKDERCCVAPYTSYNPTTAQNIENHGGTVFDPPQGYVTAFDYTDTYSLAGEDSASSHFEWNFDNGLKLRHLLSYSDGSADDARDADFTDVDVSYQPEADLRTRTATTELTLQGTAGPLDWLGGVFMSDEAVGTASEIIFGEDAGTFLLGNFSPPVPPGTPILLYQPGSGLTATSDQTGRSASIFTHNVYRFGEHYELTGGLRYLLETKEGGGEVTTTVPACLLPEVPPGTLPPSIEFPLIDQAGLPSSLALNPNLLRQGCAVDPYRRDYKDKRLTGTAALARNFDSGLYLYGSYSKGFKSGGINLNPGSTIGGTFTFRPETIDNYEIGIRAPMFGGNLQTRATFFYMDLKDYQLNTFDGTVFTVSNAGQVQAKGIELENDIRVFPGIAVKANVVYTQAIYGEATEDPALRGKQLTNAPRLTGQLSTFYLIPIGNFTIFGSLAARYQSEVNAGLDLDDGKAQEAYTLLNGRIGLRFPFEFEASLAVTNITDVYYNQIIFDSITKPPLLSGTIPGTTTQPGSFNGYPGAPRTISLELRKRF